MDEVKKKNSSVGTDDENAHETLFNLKRLNEGYGTIVDKMGYTKFKPYLQRLFQSVETMLTNEITEFRKIDAKYQDIVRQCHIYEKTLAMTKENNFCETNSFNESSNTYAFEDLTKVTPYLAPDLLQSTMGANANGAGGSTSLHFRLPRRRSSLSNQQFVSTPLGPMRTSKTNGAAPVAKFDEDPSFVLTTSLGFQQIEKCFVDAATDAEPYRTESKCQEIQTDNVMIEHVACQIEVHLHDYSSQTNPIEQNDFSIQISPLTIEQTTETERISLENEMIQTDRIECVDISTQIQPETIDEQIETIRILTENFSTQTSIEFDEQEIQTEMISSHDIATQYEDQSDPIVLSEDLPVYHEVEISVDEQSCQTETSLDRYSSSLYIVPTNIDQCQSSSTIVIYPRSVSPLKFDEEIQCDLQPAFLPDIPIVIEKENRIKDRRSFIQQQLDEKEKQMNRIIEEYAILYGEYESERRLNMDLAETRDRLADHIKILSDELGDREITQEKLLIKSCQQSKLINYMLPQIDCSPMPKKKYHSANSLRRLLPKFK